MTASKKALDIEKTIRRFITQPAVENLCKPTRSKIDPWNILLKIRYPLLGLFLKPGSAIVSQMIPYRILKSQGNVMKVIAI
jgi:hypothetical protein